LKYTLPSWRCVSVALIALAIIGAALLRAATSRRALNVVIAPVVVGDIDDTVLAVGTIGPYKLVSVGAQASGQIKSLKVKLGDRVQSGDLIAEIDATTEENSLRNARAALVSLRAQRNVQAALRKQAGLAFERQKTLLQQDGTSHADYESAEATLATARAQIASLDAQISQGESTLDTAKATLGYTKINAPLSGTILAIVAKEGQTVNANQTTPTIVKLAQLDTITVSAEISEADVIHVRPGQKAYFTILGDPRKRYESRLRSIAPAPQSLEVEVSPAASSGSASNAVYYNALLDFANPDGALRVSMTAEVHIVLAEVKDALTIPAAALSEPAKNVYTVKVIDDDERITTRSVRIGLNNFVTAQVVAGLKAGEHVVISSGTK
jgi:membrane fusion protein, macrolide-specific efflux system